MASDRQRYSRAVSKWNELRAAREFSASPEHGRTAVFVTRYGYGEHEQDTLASMRREAKNYAKVMRDFCAGVDVHETVTADLVKEAIQDPKICSLMVIGEGGFSNLFDDREDYESTWWHDVSEWTTHLKQGVFYQRFCGNHPESVPVPYGTFAMMSLNQVWAAPGKTFSPEYDPQVEHDFRPVSNSDALTYNQMVTTFHHQGAPKPTGLSSLMPSVHLAVGAFLAWTAPTSTEIS